MARKKKKGEAPRGTPGWMVSWSDLTTLLLTFFVALISMSTINPGKFQQVVVGIQTIFKGAPPSVLSGGKTMSPEPLITSNPGIKRELLRIKRSEKFKGKITVKEVPEGTLISLRDMAFFTPGSAKLTTDAKEILSQIGGIIIEHTVNPLKIFGFTNDVPIPPTSRYPSNWHLGAARAASVAYFFTHELKNRRAKERAVDIKLGRFDIDRAYDPERFIPITVGEKAIMAEKRYLKLERNSKIELEKLKLNRGEITKEQYNAAIGQITREYADRSSELRDKYRRIDILILRKGEGM